MLENSGSLTRLRNAGINRGGRWLIRGVDMDVEEANCYPHWAERIWKVDYGEDGSWPHCSR